jgi:hypothetical protein
MDLSLPVHVEFRLIYAGDMFKSTQLSSVTLRLMYADRVLVSILDGIGEVSISGGSLLFAWAVRGCPSVGKGRRILQIVQALIGSVPQEIHVTPLHHQLVLVVRFDHADESAVLDLPGL